MKLRLLICLILSFSLLLLASCGKDKDTDGEGAGDQGTENGGGTPEDEKDYFIKSDTPPIDYLKENISEYITLPESGYKGLTLKPNISAPSPIMTEVELLKILGDQRKVVGEGQKLYQHTIGAGDLVSIFYRGYYVDEKTGEPVSVAGMSNFDGIASELVIGSGQFIPGFEYNMIGKNTGEYASFSRIVSGAVEEDMVIYLTYKGTLDGESISGNYERIELSGADEIYGEGFTEKIKGAEINKTLNSFTTALDGKERVFSEVKVEFATRCEKESTNGGKPIMVVECYFPYNYGMELLQNKTAYFEVYVEYAVDYSVPELNDDFIRSVLEEKKYIAEEELLKYEGEDLTEKFKSFLSEALYKDYENNLDGLIENEIWKHLLDAATVIKYPEGNVYEIYNDYISELKAQYDKYGGRYFNSSSQLVTCKDLGEFARLYLGLGNDADWEAEILNYAESLIKERLIIYYILGAEAIADEATIAAKIAELKAEYLEEYIKEYLDYYEKDREDYSDEEFKKLEEELSSQVYGYYDDAYFSEQVCYPIVIKALKELSVLEKE